MFNSTSNKFGGRDIQNRIQRRGHSEGLAGKRGSDPQIHATSKPWHTSAAGIHMSVGLTGQVSQQPKAKQYLNKMKLTELAQKKRGLNSDPANADMGGRDSKRGLRGSVASGRSNRPPQGSMGPSQDVVDRWQQDIQGRAQSIEGGAGAQLRAQEIAAAGPAGPVHTGHTGIAAINALDDNHHHKQQYQALAGQMKKAKKHGQKRYF